MTFVNLPDDGFDIDDTVDFIGFCRAAGYWWGIQRTTSDLHKIDDEGNILNTYDFSAYTDSEFGMTYNGTHLVIIDYNRKIIKVDPSDGSFVAGSEKYLSSSAIVNRPRGITWDGTYYYIADGGYGHGRIVRYNSDFSSASVVAVDLDPPATHQLRSITYLDSKIYVGGDVVSPAEVFIKVYNTDIERLEDEEFDLHEEQTLLAGMGNYNGKIYSTGRPTGPVYVYGAAEEVTVVPDRPAAPTATATTSQVVLDWADPASNVQNNDITGYRILRKVSGGSLGTYRENTGNNDTTFTDSIVTEGTTYIYRVVAINSFGESARSPFVSITVPETTVADTVPEAPVLTLAVDDAELDLSWTEPDDGGDDITGYEYAYKTASASTWSTAVSTTNRTASISSLTNGTSYNVRVRAINSVGNSDWSSVQSATPADTTAPQLSAPANITLEATAENSAFDSDDYGTATSTESGVDITSDAPSTFPLGDTEITWTAEDSSGNETTATQTVTVEDTTAPTLTIPSDKSGTVSTSTGTISITVGTATSTDLVDGTITPTRSPTSTSFGVGTHTITWTATDDAGNETTAEQTITITLAEDEEIVELDFDIKYKVNNEGIAIVTIQNRKDFAERIVLS